MAAFGPTKFIKKYSKPHWLLTLVLIFRRWSNLSISDLALLFAFHTHCSVLKKWSTLFYVL